MDKLRYKKGAADLSPKSQIHVSAENGIYTVRYSEKRVYLLVSLMLVVIT